MAGSWNQQQTRLANRAGQPDLRHRGDSGQQRGGGHARKRTAGTGRHAQVSRATWPDCGNGSATRPNRPPGNWPGNLAARPSCTRRPAWSAARPPPKLANLAVVDASGQQFQEPRIRLVGPRQLRQQVRHRATGAVRTGLRRLGGQRRRTHRAGKRREQRRHQRDKSATTWNGIAGLLRPYIGPGVRIAGRGSSAAWYRGPFALANRLGRRQLAMGLGRRLWRSAGTRRVEGHDGQRHGANRAA